MADVNANQQADQAAFPYPPGVLPPEHEETDTSGTTATQGTTAEQKTLSDVQKQALAEQDQAAEGAIKLTGEQRAQKEKENAITADSAARAAAAGEGYATETQKAMAEGEKMISEARARAQLAQQRLDATPPAALFHHGDTWGNILRGFGMALGAVGDAKQAYAAVRTGHAPPTLDTVGQIINADLDKQKAHIAELKDRVVMARTGIDDAFKARQQMMQDIDLRGAAAYAQLERIARARLAATGLSQPEIDQHAAIQAIQEKRAEQHAKYVEPLYNQITAHVETARKKDQAVTNRTNNSLQTQQIQGAMAAPQLAQDFKTVAGYHPGILESVTPRAFLDAEGQSFEDANNRLKTHVLGELASKKLVANEKEADRVWRETYEIRPTDAPDARANKLKALGQLLNADTYGQVGRQLSAPGAAPAPAEKPAPPKTEAPAKPAASKPTVPEMDRTGYIRALRARLDQALKDKDTGAAERIRARIREVNRAG